MWLLTDQPCSASKAIPGVIPSKIGASSVTSARRGLLELWQEGGDHCSVL